MTTNDQLHIKAILNGDTQAFSILVDRYQDMVFTLALRMLKHREEAEEVAQDTFIKVFKSLSRFKGDSKFSTWIYKIAYNCCLDRLKRNKRQWNTVAIDSFTENRVKALEDTFKQLETKERHEAIRKCIDKLPAQDGFILTLYYFDELPLEEVAKVMGVTSNNAKVKLFRSRKRLATLLRSQLEPEILNEYEESYRPAVR
ncbi:MAG: sigma-70 family RNA polymerase sigma factor [Flavobacteriaceae bacterium]|nr:sigma-70 family RNA polymerase sigma factor [Bacteroidia bacterium]MBT8286748.1 sigma-70 family RNA polymerase sigma factor [Bacteroidia bacterium]NNF75241.1 sigma-70 family RNA polymerase sigma factor [Flavobacteriaceae bacterium]NNK74204.1 sigma-70 family RNA polymerase sigma factor [Flavobacteriaceae bacterium]